MGEIDERTRKLVQSIRRMGSEMNMSIPPSRMKSEAKRIRDKCNELIAALGGDEE